jgi:hypothetical protein
MASLRDKALLLRSKKTLKRQQLIKPNEDVKPTLFNNGFLHRLINGKGTFDRSVQVYSVLLDVETLDTFFPCALNEIIMMPQALVLELLVAVYLKYLIDSNKVGADNLSKVGPIVVDRLIREHPVSIRDIRCGGGACTTILCLIGDDGNVGLGYYDGENKIFLTAYVSQLEGDFSLTDKAQKVKFNLCL